jgi:hypothetical protein
MYWQYTDNWAVNGYSSDTGLCSGISCLSMVGNFAYSCNFGNYDAVCVVVCSGLSPIAIIKYCMSIYCVYK